MTDLELVARARGGDAQAFGELVERHRVAAYRAARAALGSPWEADDVVQEACVAAYSRLAGFRGEASFRTWLVAITWRRALTRRRSLARWMNGLGRREAGRGAELLNIDAPDAGADTAPCDAATPERVLLGREMASAIARLVRQLPPTLRDPLLLVGSQEFSYDEVAALVGAPVGTVKWRVSEARRRIALRLRRLGYGDVR